MFEMTPFETIISMFLLIFFVALVVKAIRANNSLYCPGIVWIPIALMALSGLACARLKVFYLITMIIGLGTWCILEKTNAY